MKRFALLKLVGKNKDARRDPREQQTPLTRPLPPAVEARRLKLLDRAVRVEASRLKPKSVHHANLRATPVAEAPISFPVNGALGEALVQNPENPSDWTNFDIGGVVRLFRTGGVGAHRLTL